jgi:uncharacterized protein (DUF433 family)
VRALHHVVTRNPRVQRGEAVFAGTRVPVRALLEHLDQGRDFDAFFDRYRSVPRDLAAAALALGLEALIHQVPTEPPPAQRSLLPRLDSSGAILNAEELRADQVIGRRVLCPGCRRLVFRSWPEGWDGHAAGRCRGLAGSGGEARKAEFKHRFGGLFRS